MNPLAMVAGGLHAGRGRSAAARHGGLARSGRIERHRERLVRRMMRQGHRARVRRARVRADPRLRRVRLSREPRGQLCPDRLRHGLAEALLPGSLHLFAAQRAADGFLLAATIVEDAKRHDVRDPARGRRTQRDWDCTLERTGGPRATGSLARGAHGTALRQGASASRGRAHRPHARSAAGRPFESRCATSSRVAGLATSRHVLARLAEAGASPAGFESQRRAARCGRSRRLGASARVRLAAAHGRPIRGPPEFASSTFRDDRLGLPTRPGTARAATR